MDTALQELNQKIDLLTAQVSYLSAQAQLQERQRVAQAELVRDITPLANQAYSLAVEQLEEVQEYIDLGDLMRLFKRLLRNGRNIEKMLDQLESLADLVETLGPLADEAFSKAVDVMSGMEAKGYFGFARGGAKMMDSIVTSVSEEELSQIGTFTSSTLVELKSELGKPVDVSYMSLLKQMRDPSVRRGMALTLRIMQVIGKQANDQTNPIQ